MTGEGPGQDRDGEQQESAGTRLSAHSCVSTLLHFSMLLFPPTQKYLPFRPWLVWLSGLSAGLQTKGSWVQFPVRAHAWVVGQVPSRGHMRDNHTLMFLSPSLSPSLPLYLKISR